MEVTTGKAVRVGFLLFCGLAVVVFAAAYLGVHRLAPGVGNAVALVRVEGPILDARKVVETIRTHQRDQGIKAMVLRVNSPGGGVVPSQEIHDAVVAFQAAGKPVVVSMGTVAASGGYYIAAPADAILANPGTLTGSIGVIMSMTNVEGLMDKLGLTNVTIKSGANKDVGSPFRTMTDADRALLQGVMDDIHDQFIQAVADGRGREADEIRPLADGRVFSGQQAVAEGLVDALGNLDAAVKKAGMLAGIDGRPRVIELTPTAWEQFLSGAEGWLPWSVSTAGRWGGMRAMYLMSL